MPSNQWHISDQPVFAQRLHNSSSESQKENKSIDSNTAQQTCFGPSHLLKSSEPSSEKYAVEVIAPNYRRNLGRQERLWVSEAEEKSEVAASQVEANPPQQLMTSSGGRLGQAFLVQIDWKPGLKNVKRM